MTAYMTVFAPYHGPAIRNAATDVMSSLPTRARMLVLLGENGEFISRNLIIPALEMTRISLKYSCLILSEASAKVLMRKYIDASVVVTRYIDQLFASKGLTVDWS